MPIPLSPVILAVSLAVAPLAQTDAATRKGEGILADGFVSHVDAMLGVRLLDGKWDVDNASTLALGGRLGFQTRGLDWPVGFQVAYGFAENNDDSNVKAELEARDLELGIFMPFGDADALHFDLGAGFHTTWLTIRRKKVAVGQIEDEEVRGSGGYLRGALRMPLNDYTGITAIGSYSFAPGDSVLAGDDNINTGGLAFYGAFTLHF